MHRIDGAGATIDNKFTEGDPVGGVQATVVTDDWLNDVQEELVSILAAAGITPTKGVQDQVLKSIGALIRVQKFTAFSASGSSPAFALSPNPAITAYETGQRFRVKFGAASSGTDTLNISAKGPKSIKQYDTAGAKVQAVFAAGQLVDIEYDGTDIVLLNPLPAISQATESVAGVAKIATQSQTDTGVDDSKFVTPLKMRKGFSVAFGSTGYIALPSWMGGWIMQWVSAGAISGLATKGTATRPLVWLLTFPTEVLAQWGIAVGATAADVGMVATASLPTTTGMTLGIYNSAEASKNMSNTIGFAIGR